MADIARLNVLIEAKAEGLEKELQGASQRLQQFGSRMQGIGTKLSLAVTAPIVGIGAAALKAAADAEESENLFEVALGNMAGAARAFSEETADALGRNSIEIRRNIGSFNALFTTLGLGQRAAFDMSTALATLTIDLASFFNISEQDAFRRLQSGLAGEAEALRRLNVFLTEATIQQIAYANGIAETGAELTEAQKVHARYLGIVEQTALAQGDAARTSDSVTNQMRAFKEQVKETAVNLGKLLIPAFQRFLRFANSVIDRVGDAIAAFRGLPGPVQTLALALVGLVAAAGPVLFIFGSLVNVMGSVALVASTAAGSAAIGGLAALLATGGPLVLGAIALAGALGLVAAKLTESSREAKRAKEELDRFREALGTPVTIDLVRDFNVAASLAAVKVAELREEIERATAAGDVQRAFGLRDDLKAAEAEMERLIFRAEQINRLDVETEATIRAKIEVEEGNLTAVLNRIREIEENIARLPEGQLRGSQRGVLARLEERAAATSDRLLELERDLGTFTQTAVQNVATATGTVDGLAEALATIRGDLQLLAARADVFDLSELEVAEERVRILESGLNALLALDLSPNSEIVRQYAARWDEAREAVERLSVAVEAIDPSKLTGILSPAQTGTLAQGALGGLDVSGLTTLGPGPVTEGVERDMEAALAVGRSFEAGFQQLGTALIRAMGQGMVDAQDLLLSVFSTILNSLLSFGLGALFGSIFGGAKQVAGAGNAVAGTSGVASNVAAVTGGSGGGFQVVVDMSGASLFADPAAVARTPGGQIFVREGIVTAREGGF